MPRGDATGPMGMGPMTGRGAGYCAGFGAPGYINNLGGRGFGAGLGKGAWFGGRGGRGGGFGYRNHCLATGVPRRFCFGGPTAPYFNTDQEAEKQALNNQTEILQAELDAVKKRLDELNRKTQKN